MTTIRINNVSMLVRKGPEMDGINPKRIACLTCEIRRHSGKWRPDFYNHIVGMLKEYIRWNVD